jgi:uncharacterized protein (TIGR02569 family)
VSRRMVRRARVAREGVVAPPPRRSDAPCRCVAGLDPAARRTDNNLSVLAPPAAVLAQFGITGRPEPLSGGQGTAWRAGAVVLKPLDMSAEALRWQADVLNSLPCDGFRVAAPLRSRDGELVVDGWTAWPLLAGTHEPRWHDILAVGVRFHRALASLERPAAVLDARDDAWARADRIAWGEEEAGRFGEVPEVAHLVAARVPIDASSQVIHGDLSGNVLFADGLAPAVIDVSPYWRPADYASAIVVVDAVLWYDAEPELLSSVARAENGAQLLVRALLFRLLASRDPAAAASGYRRAIEVVDGLLEGRG